MKKYLFVFALIWLTAVVCFIWGAAMVAYQVFPYSLYRDIRAFLIPRPTDKRPFLQRLRDDHPFALALNPSPFPIQLPLKPVDTSSYRGPTITSLEDALYYSATEQEEYFLIYGSFAFEDTNWGVILISTRGRVLRAWPMTQKARVPPAKNEGYQGLVLSKTGDLATNARGVLTSYDWCGGKNWEVDDPLTTWEGKMDTDGIQQFHHDITYHEGRFYTFIGTSIVSVDENTGEIRERIHMVDLMRSARDQDLAIFGARIKTGKALKVGELTATNLLSMMCVDPFHLNKVDVLSRELADSFDEFEVGDLLVSMRELNLVFVFRPKTSKILWYRYGLTSRQHDATFQRGYISVFNNNPFANSGPSPQIVKLGVEEHTRSILFDLKTWGATMPIHGSFELDEERNLLAFSDDFNGRALVGDLAGKPTFLFENRIESGKILPLRSILRVPARKVEEWSARCD